jgi:hypothetical protein
VPPATAPPVAATARSPLQPPPLLLLLLLQGPLPLRQPAEGVGPLPGVGVGHLGAAGVGLQGVARAHHTHPRMPQLVLVGVAHLGSPRMLHWGLGSRRTLGVVPHSVGVGRRGRPRGVVGPRTGGVAHHSEGGHLLGQHTQHMQQQGVSTMVFISHSGAVWSIGKILKGC